MDALSHRGRFDAKDLRDFGRGEFFEIAQDERIAACLRQLIEQGKPSRRRSRSAVRSLAPQPEGGWRRDDRRRLRRQGKRVKQSVRRARVPGAWRRIHRDAVAGANFDSLRKVPRWRKADKTPLNVQRIVHANQPAGQAIQARPGPECQRVEGVVAPEDGAFGQCLVACVPGSRRRRHAGRV